MSSFAAGALIGDVFIHNLPEIQRSYQHNSLYICWGILSLFMLEKIISYYEEKNKKLNVNGKQTNIIISLVGDFMHNFTDGMAIGAGFNKNLKLGVSLSLSIFFHEIPHEVGDFSYLLKQNMNITNAVISQLITALGSFLGVYVSFEFGEMYSDRIISFASGAFLYLAINTIMGDLKRSRSLLHISYQAIAFIFGVCILDALL
jgi:zinc transporter ZupT